MKHLTEEELILLYYAEPGVLDDAHLAECRQCRLRAESLAATLDMCSEWRVAEPDAQFERSVWARLAPQIPPRERAGWFRFRFPARGRRLRRASEWPPPQPGGEQHVADEACGCRGR